LLGPQIVNVDAKCLTELTAAITAVWPVAPPLTLWESPGGANAQTHIVAVDAAGACVGLKAANRIAYGTQRECLISELASMLEMPLRPQKRLMQPIQNLPKIGAQDFVADRWYNGAEVLDKIDKVQGGAAIRQAVTADPMPLLIDYGAWLGFGLVFGINDRNNAGNWVCTADGPRIGMVDTEESLTGPARHADYRLPLEFWSLLVAVNAPRPPGGRNPQRSAVARGLRRFYKNWAGSHKKVMALVNANAASNGYRSIWMGLGPTAFMDQALSGLV
jgi:hypothetical protein